MSIRALSSLLIRRFSPRRIPVPTAAAQAETIGSPSGRPARSLHTLSNPDASVAALGALSLVGLTALGGFLYLKKDGKVGEVSRDEGASNVVVTHMITDMEAVLNDPDILSMFTDKHGNVAWLEYSDYIVYRAQYLDRKARLTDGETSRKVPMKRVGNVIKVDEEALKKRIEVLIKKHNDEYKNHMKMVMEQEYKLDEAVMKKRFEDWMKEFGRTYKGAEKARRYEVFKDHAISADKLNAHYGGTSFGTTNFSDWTEAELMSMNCHQGDNDWMKSHFDYLRAKYAEGRVDIHQRKVALQELDCTDAVKERFKELAARKAEQERQASKKT